MQREQTMQQNPSKRRGRWRRSYPSAGNSKTFPTALACSHAISPNIVIASMLGYAWDVDGKYSLTTALFQIRNPRHTMGFVSPRNGVIPAVYPTDSWAITLAQTVVAMSRRWLCCSTTESRRTVRQKAVGGGLGGDGLACGESSAHRSSARVLLSISKT